MLSVAHPWLCGLLMAIFETNWVIWQKSSQSVDDWYRRFDELLTRAQEMIYKEQNILFPICAENFTTQDWYQIYKDTAQYEEIFGVKRIAWPEADAALATQTRKSSGDDNTIGLIGGTLTVDQLDAMLNTMPMEVTFVDHEDINRYFNDGEKVFKRPTTAIGRDVFSCHPPKGRTYRARYHRFLP